jgi:hypothetical protein
MAQSAARHANDANSASPKRSPGRPKKPELASQPCGEEFDMVSAGVVALASAEGGIWAATKEALRARADREKGFSPATPKVIGFVLQHINLEKGYDWHSAQTIATELILSIRSVERAFREARLAGYFLREVRDDIPVKGSQATKPWRTTVPMLLVIAKEITAKKGPEGPDRKIQRTRQKNSKDPTNMSGKYEKNEYEKGNTHTHAYARARRVRGEFNDILEGLRQKGRDQRNAINHFLAPLLATKPLQQGVPDRQAYVAELVDGIAAMGFETVVLDHGLSRSRQERSTMPSLPMCLELLNGIKREIAAERATRELGANDNGSPSADTRTSAFHAQLRLLVGDIIFRAWKLNELRVECVEETKLTISVPGDGGRRMIIKYHQEDLEAASRATFGERVARVEIVVREADQSKSSTDRYRQLQSEIRALEVWISCARWDPQSRTQEPCRRATAH